MRVSSCGLICVSHRHLGSCGATDGDKHGENMCCGAGGISFNLNICRIFRKNDPVSRRGVRVGMRRRVRILGPHPASEERKEQVPGPVLSRTTTSQDPPAQRWEQSTAGHW